MKLILLKILLLLTTVTFAQFSGTSFKEAKSSGKAIWIYTYAATPGFAYAGEKGELKGICFDIMSDFKDYVKKEHNIEVTTEIKDGSSEDFQKFLKEVKGSQGGTFGLGNITITEARKREFQFSPPFITNISVIVTNKMVPTLSSIENINKDFAGKTAYTVVNSTNASSLQKLKKAHFSSMKIINLNSSPEVLDRVLADQNAFANIDFTYWLFSLKQKQPVKRHPAGDESTEKFGIIMSKTNDWEPVLREFLNSGYVGSTEYKKIIAKHLGQNALDLVESVTKN
ncbi:MAG: transporter substrate-binding domain-containing protein [Bacteroidota bacterium]